MVNLHYIPSGPEKGYGSRLHCFPSCPVKGMAHDEPALLDIQQLDGGILTH